MPFMECKINCGKKWFRYDAQTSGGPPIAKDTDVVADVSLPLCSGLGTSMSRSHISQLAHPVPSGESFLAVWFGSALWFLSQYVAASF
jgi:hypothetical protein